MNFFLIFALVFLSGLVNCNQEKIGSTTATATATKKVISFLNENKLETVMDDLFSIVRKASDVRFGDVSKLLGNLRSNFMPDDMSNDSRHVDEDDDMESEHNLKEKRESLDEEADDVVLLLRKALKNLLDAPSTKSTTTKKIGSSTKKLLQANRPVSSTNLDEKNKGEQKSGSNKLVKLIKLAMDTLLKDTHIDENQKVFKD